MTRTGYHAIAFLLFNTAAGPAIAQTLPPGVINAPPTLIGDNESIGSDTTLNVLDRGSVGFSFDAGLSDRSSTNVVVNISGGRVGDEFRAYSGSTVEIDGGLVSGLTAYTGATVNVRGGTVGSLGALSDASVTLTGGRVDRFSKLGSNTATINGGIIGSVHVQSAGSLRINGGSVGELDVQSNNGRGGEPTSMVDIRGGTISDIRTIIDSTLNIAGGTVGLSPFFSPFSIRNNTVSISGGAASSSFLEALNSSSVEFVGGEFQLNGTPYLGSSITLSRGDLFSGTFADGSPFVFGTGFSNYAATLTASTLPPLETTPMVVDASSSAAPAGLRIGQTLTLRDGGQLGDNFAAIGAVLNVEAGQTGANLAVESSTVNISGGTVGENFTAYAGSTVNVSGGTVGPEFMAGSGSTLHISGGTLDGPLLAGAGSKVNLRGGTVGNFFRAFRDSQVEISGGSFGDSLGANSGSMVSIIGTEFFLDGNMVDLEPGTPTLITRRDASLTGILADGSDFGFDLSSISPDAHFTLNLVPVPEPASFVAISLVAAAIGGRRMRSLQARRKTR